MVVAFEIALAAALVAVGISYAVAARGRLGRRAAIALAACFGVTTIAASVLVAVSLATDRFDWRDLAVTAAGFALAAGASLGALALGRGLARAATVSQVERAMLERLDEALAVSADRRLRELDQTLARERAETNHLVAEQERQLRDERRMQIETETEAARALLTDAVAEAQHRMEQRLSAWSADLERSQQQLKTRVEDLGRRQADALRDHEHRLADHSSELQTLEEHQNMTIARIRTELEQAVSTSLESARSDLEIHAAERRRALHEVGERLRARERAMREQVEREETELKAQLSSMLAEVERRQLEQLERALDRAVVRLSEDAERQFDRQLRDARERTAERLSRELELSMEHFMKAAENEVVNRIAEAAQGSAARFQRQIDDLVRAAEVQTGISNERIQALAERLDKSLDAAHTRLNDFEAHVELELSTKLGEIERVLRSAGDTADRAQTRR